MRGRNLAVLLGVFMAVPALVGAAPIAKVNQSFPISFATPGICAEVVDAGGSIHILGSTTFSNGGNYRTSFHFNLQNVTGVGTISGDDYTVDAAGNISVAGSVKNGSSRFTAIFNGTQTDLDSGSIASLHVNVQFTVDAKGNVTAQVLNVEVICPF